MVEDVKYSGNAAKTAFDSNGTKKSADSEFQKYLNQTTGDVSRDTFHADYKQGKEVKEAAQKSKEQKEVKKIKNDEESLLISDDSKLSKLDAKEQIAQSAANAKDSKNQNLAQALQGAKSSAAMPNNATSATIAGSTATGIAGANLVQNQSLKEKEILARDTQAAQNLNSEKTLADVKNLANQKGLNVQSASITSGVGDEVLSESVIEAPKPRAPREIPESAKQKIKYEVESKDERVAVVNRGVKKPSNITSKISNVYEDGKNEKVSSGGALGSLLGLKDLP